jgi:UDP-N-acetylglucosamine/UDP-N-acetylgalactosamine diphosphorylase
MTTTDSDEATIRKRYQAAGQEHVFKHIDTLPSKERKEFLQQLQEIPVESIADLLEAARHDTGSNGEITPFSKHVGRTSDKKEMEVAYQKGMDAIAQGHVAALVLAGGQGTRLGFDGPKGCYDIGLPSGRTLFRLLAERLLRLKHIAASDHATTPSLPFYIMTSPINHEQTMQYFKDQKYFGLPEEDVHFFQQGMLPCLTEEGKIILESAGTVAMAPDGYVCSTLETRPWNGVQGICFSDFFFFPQKWRDLSLTAEIWNVG